jgi:predicted regulator of amino acid metabolism with ACT domain
MWGRVSRKFQAHPERLAVVRVLVENGLSVRGGRIYCNEIEIPDSKIAKVAGVVRRTVAAAIAAIESDPHLRPLFEGLRSAGHSLKGIARQLGLGVLEITPLDARTPGILAAAASLLANKGISVRQAIVDDPELAPEPKLTLIAEGPIPAELIPEFLKIRGVAKVSIY